MKKFQKLIFTLCLTLFSLNILLSFSSKKYEVILSILVDTFISKISFPMQPGPEIGSISDA